MIRTSLIRAVLQKGRILSLWALVVLSTIFNSESLASPTSYTLFNPAGWLHSLPTGEAPGWTDSSWFQLDISQGNTWNQPLSLYNKQNGKNLKYQVDMGQTSYVFNFGTQISSRLALSVELPYAVRNGGILDNLIDEFHIIIGNERFGREHFAENLSNYSLKVDGVDLLEDNTQSGLGNAKLKLKYWMWKWQSRTRGACECGFSTSAHIKFPVAEKSTGLTSNSVDYSLVAHLGFPLFKASGIWLTSSVTQIPENDLLKDWPVKEWHQMYEISTSFSIGKSWSLIFQVRAESPYLDKNQVIITDVVTDQDLLDIASAWNTLFHWRGSESLGFQYRSRGGSYINFLMIEDWAPGQFDKPTPDEAFYVNNAPDLMFLVQSHLAF